MRKVSIAIPVRYREKDGSVVTTRYGIAEAKVMVVEDPAEAPVAVTWDDGTDIHEYPAFDGSLWAPVVDSWGWVKREGTDLWPDGEIPSGTVHVDDARGQWFRAFCDPNLHGRITEHPFKSGETWAKAHPSEKTIVKFDIIQRENAELDRISEQLVAQAGDAMVFKGLLWRRSPGPVLTYAIGAPRIASRLSFGNRLAYSHPDDRWGSMTLESRAYRFDGFDPDEAIDLVSRGFGKEAEIVGPVPEVLSPDGYGFDLLPSTVESTAWHMIWMTKDVDTPSASLAAVSAILGLRKALQDRWPGEELNFSPALHETTWRHTLGKTIPDPSPLLPAMEVVARDCAALVPDRIACAWNVGVERLRRHVAGVHHPADDEDAIAAMVL